MSEQPDWALEWLEHAANGSDDNIIAQIDAQTLLDRIRELEALKDRIIDQTTADMCDLQSKLKAAEAKLAAIAAWYERNRLRLFDVNDDELEALLQGER